MRSQKPGIKNILVATDFSPCSDNALKRAIKIAKEYKAKITLFHVIEKTWLDATMESLLPRKLLKKPFEDASDNLNAQFSKIKKAGIQCEIILLKTGSAKLKIIQHLRKKKFELLVMGAHGKYSMRDNFVGTTAEYISSHSVCPVLIIKSDNQKPYQKVFIPIDFSPLSKRVISVATSMLPKAKFNLLYVADQEYDAIFKRESSKYSVPEHKIENLKNSLENHLHQQIKALIKANPELSDTKSFKIRYGYPGPTIVEEVNAASVDLVVIGAQGNTKKHYLFVGHVAYYVLSEIDKDILIIPK